ncbi:hypothetical protein ABK040_002666 [Willaertia magna]
MMMRRNDSSNYHHSGNNNSEGFFGSLSIGLKTRFIQQWKGVVVLIDILFFLLPCLIFSIWGTTLLIQTNFLVQSDGLQSVLSFNHTDSSVIINKNATDDIFISFNPFDNSNKLFTCHLFVFLLIITLVDWIFLFFCSFGGRLTEKYYFWSNKIKEEEIDREDVNQIYRIEKVKCKINTFYFLIKVFAIGLFLLGLLIWFTIEIVTQTRNDIYGTQFPLLHMSYKVDDNEFRSKAFNSTTCNDLLSLNFTQKYTYENNTDFGSVTTIGDSIYIYMIIRWSLLGFALIMVPILVIVMSIYQCCFVWKEKTGGDKAYAPLKEASEEEDENDYL